MPKITTVIAAGGLGTRLIGYKGNDSTKMLLKVNDLSMISHQLNQLIGWGLDNFVIVTNPLFDNMIREDVLRNFNKVKIKFVLQQEQLGVAHALHQSEKAVPKNNMILYILGDNFSDDEMVSTCLCNLASL